MEARKRCDRWIYMPEKRAGMQKRDEVRGYPPEHEDG
jgi:hypothetical protein